MTKNFKITAAASFLAVISSILLTSEAYYGNSATEAMLTYVATIEVKKGSTPAQVDEKIQEQISHLMGTFQSESFSAAVKNPGVLGEDFNVKVIRHENSPTPGYVYYHYSFKGKTVFKKTAFRGEAETKKIPIKLPLAPDKIYELGVVRGKNLCTDEHYNSEGDFWYFWDPDMPGCPLKGNHHDVVRVDGTLTKLPNTKISYPEYDRLYGKNGNKSDLDVSVFLGYIDEEARPGKPNRKDDAFLAMQDFEKYLLGEKYKLALTQDAFRVTDANNEKKGANFYRIYEKEVDGLLGKTMKVKVKILLADTGINAKDPTFHKYLVPALEKSDIVVYDGHSGLGGNLHLDYLPPVKFSKTKYQIFFFNGCSSYPYYNGMFMKAKGRSGSLDILTAGLPTLSSTTSPNLQAFLDGFLSGKILSYQKILKDLDKSNGEEGTYLFGVSGDQDNKFKP